MWQPDIPSWCYYNSMSMPDPNAQFVNTLYPQQQQQQAFVSPGSSRQPTYAYAPQLQPTQPRPTSHYYGLSQTQPVNNFLNSYNSFNSTNTAQMQAQAVSLARAQQQAWIDYPAQKPPQSFNYWYQNQENLSILAPQSFCETKPIISLEDGSLACQQQGSHSSALSCYPAGNRQGIQYFSHHSSGSLNRIDSVSSFKNQQGLRIRNSEQDLVEYRRIAARKLKSVEKQEVSGLRAPQELQIREIEQKCSLVNENYQVEIRPKAPLAQNVVVEGPLESRDNGFFKKLGLFKEPLLRRQQKPAQLHTNSNCCDQNCDPSSSQAAIERPRKKRNFWKRLFGGMHYPSNVDLRVLMEQDQLEAIEFGKR
ncbi:uncharacterized protein [Drosophila virilis]|uniref:Uncharacterized protein n=1 Tax=Drosophila virilis TaxID=7244 RepID=B4LUQ3_DROVI|nr:uncharacterized protein LOC6628783 [Drosophila virilis]EDW63221.2 uncharacterized protein Dvir_GJ14156 [Drosophila virilis]